MEEWKKNIKKKNPNGEILALLDKYGNDYMCNMFVLSLSPDRNSIFFVKRQQEKVTEKIFFVPLE